MLDLKKHKFERVYHHYLKWEENQFNMWGTVKNKAEYLKMAIAFTADHKLYGLFMQRVAEEWPISCENALTDYSLNQKAWIGHAAVAMALKCPENITREAWGYLTDEQRLLANNEAEKAICSWRVNYAKSKGLLPDVGSEMLC